MVPVLVSFESAVSVLLERNDRFLQLGDEEGVERDVGHGWCILPLLVRQGQLAEHLDKRIGKRARANLGRNSDSARLEARRGYCRDHPLPTRIKCLWDGLARVEQQQDICVHLLEERQESSRLEGQAVLPSAGDDAKSDLEQTDQEIECKMEKWSRGGGQLKVAGGASTYDIQFG